MGQFLLRDGSGSVSSPQHHHTRGVGEGTLTRAVFYIHFTQSHSPRASDKRFFKHQCAFPLHSTAQIHFQDQLSGTADLSPFLQVQHLLKSCPYLTDGEMESQRWDLTEPRLQTCTPLLTHLHLISCSSALREGNINRSDSQTGHHPGSQNTNFPLPSISAHLFNCQIFKAEIWVCIYDI